MKSLKSMRMTMAVGQEELVDLPVEVESVGELKEYLSKRINAKGGGKDELRLKHQGKELEESTEIDSLINLAKDKEEVELEVEVEEGNSILSIRRVEESKLEEMKAVAEERPSAEEERGPKSSACGCCGNKLARVKDMKGRPMIVKEADLATFNGRLYYLKKKKDRKARSSWTERLPQLSLRGLSFLVSYVIATLIFSFMPNRSFYVLIFVLVILNLLRNFSITVRFTKGRALSNAFKHVLCFLVSSVFNLGNNLTVYLEE